MFSTDYIFYCSRDVFCVATISLDRFDSLHTAPESYRLEALYRSGSQAPSDTVCIWWRLWNAHLRHSCTSILIFTSLLALFFQCTYAGSIQYFFSRSSPLAVLMTPSVRKPPIPTRRPDHPVYEFVSGKEFNDFQISILMA